MLAFPRMNTLACYSPKISNIDDAPHGPGTELAARRPTIALPNTCPENRRCETAHVRLLTRVNTAAWNAAGFEGRLFRPGARVGASELGERPVALECAGPQGSYKRGRQREWLWILWRYDWQLRDWIEIARARALDWKWTLVLKEPAIRALARPEPAAAQLGARGREVADELLAAIDGKLVTEPQEVRNLVLTSIYDRLAGRIAAP